MNIQLKIHVKNGSTQLIPVPMKKEVAVMVPQPKGEVSFELVDLETQLAPQRVFMKRVGNDLHIFIDEDTHVDVVIKDYYANEPLSPIMGVAEDGMLYPYLAESNLLADSIPHLTENVLASQVLGGEGVVAALLPFNWTPFLYGLAGLAGAGLVASLFRGSDAGSNKLSLAVDLQPTLNDKGLPTGGLTLKLDPSVKSYVVRFYPEGAKKPIDIVYERQPDGSFKLVTDTSKLNVQPPAVVPSGQDLLLPPDLLKDNQPVTVTALGDNGATGSATVVAPFDANTPLNFDPVVGIDRDNNGQLDAAEISGTTSPGAWVSFKDDKGNVIAEVQADSQGRFKVPVALDPNKSTEENMASLTVTATKPGENPTSGPIPSDKWPTELETPNQPVVEPAPLTPEEAANAQASTKPTISVDSIRAIDESSAPDRNPETLKFTGTAAPGAKVVVYIEKDGKAVPIATVTADKDSQYAVSASDIGKDVDMRSGDKFHVKAFEEGKHPTASDSATVPEVADGPLGHPYASVRPAEPVISTQEAPGDGGAKVSAEKLKPFETLHVHLTDEANAKHELRFSLNEQGQLVADSSNPAGVTYKIVGKSVQIDKNTILDDSNVFAHVSNIAHKQSEVKDAKAGFDDATTRDFTVTLEALDLDSPADHIADQAKVKIVGAQDGDIAHITDDVGNVLGTVTLGQEYKNDDGSYSVPVGLLDDNKPPKTVSVTLQEPGKDPSAPVTQAFPPLAPGKAGHPNDETPPPAPVLTQSEEGITVAFNPRETDKLSIVLKPSEADEKGTPVVTYTKDPATGVFKSDNPSKFPDIAAGASTVELPRAALPETGVVQAQASDLAENSKKSNEVSLEPTLPQLPPVTFTSVDAHDTSDAADKDPEAFTIKGKANPGADVIARNPANPSLIVGFTKADEEGNFTLEVREHPDHNITSATHIKVVQDLDKHRASEPANPPEAGTLSHLDNKPPKAPEVVPLGSNDVGLAIDPEATMGTVTYTDKDGQPKTATLTRQPDGTLKSDDPNVQVEPQKDAEGRDIVRVPATATTPNTIVTAKVADLAGNESGSTDVPTRDNQTPVLNTDDAAREQTATPSIDSLKGHDESLKADGKPELLTAEGTAEPGARVTLYLGGTFVVGTTADNNGKYVAQLRKPDGSAFTPETDQITAKAINLTAGKDASEPSEAKAVPVASSFDDSVAPPAPAFVSTGDSPDLAATLPEEGVIAGDKVVFTIVAPNQPDQVVTLTKREGEGWDSDNEDLIPSTNNNEVRIPDAATPPNAVVTAQTFDQAGNGSEPVSAQAGLPASGKPSIGKVTAFDTSNPADDDPEEVLVEGFAPAGSTVVIKDPKGKIIGTGKATDKGTFSIPAKQGDYDLKVGDKITVEAIEEGKRATASEPVPVPAVAPGKDGHIGDRTPPAAPTISIDDHGNGIIKLPPNAQPGDKVKGSITNTDGSSTPIEIVKGEDGQWTSPNNPSVNIDSNTATLPKLPAGSTVSVHSEDPVGNASQDDEATVPATTATPTLESIVSHDTSDVADNDPEKVTVTGTVAGEPAGTVVTLKTADGKVIGTATVTGTDGKFTVVGLERTDAELIVGGHVKAHAQAPGKTISADSSLLAIPAVPAGKDGHDDRNLPDPVKPTGAAEDKTVTTKENITLEVPTTDVNTVELQVQPEGTADDDKPTTVVLTKKPDGGFSSSHPDLVPDVAATEGEAKPTITIDGEKIKPNSVVTATTVDLADNRSESVDINVTAPASQDAAAQSVEAPEWVVKQDKSIDLLLPKANEKTGTTKVVMVYEDEATGERTTVTFKRTSGTTDDWTAENPADYPILPTANTEGVKAVTLPEALVKDGSTVFAYGSNANGSLISATVTAVAPVKLFTNTPNDIKVTPMDLDDSANDTAEKVRFEGKVAGEPVGTLVSIKDKDGNEIATTRTTDDQGNFRIDVPADKKLGDGDNAPTVADLLKDKADKAEIGDTIKVSATAPGKGESPDAQDGQVIKQPLTHADSKAPQAVLFEVDAEGNVTATFPADAVTGDKVVITVKPKDGQATEAKTATFVKQENGSWAKEGDLPANFSESVTGNEYHIPANALLKNNDRVASISAQATDVAGNASVLKSEDIAFTQTPTIESVKAIDTSYHSDNNPEKFLIKGKVAGEAVGTRVFIYDEADNLIGEGTTTDAEGNFEITAHQGAFDVVNGSKLYAKANATGKVGSEKSTDATVSVTNITHEETVPPTVELTRDTNNVVTATVSPDTKKVEITVGDKTVTADRDPETGNISNSSDPALVPNSNNGTKEQPNTTVTVNAGDKPVSAKATDVADNVGEVVRNEPAPAPEAPKAPTALSVTAVKAVDMSNPFDSDPEKALITGKTEPFAKVEVRDPSGEKLLGTATADAQGDFSLTALEHDYNIQVGDALKVTATATGKGPSATVDASVPAVSDDKDGHQGDRTPPSVVDIGRENPNQGGQGGQGGDQGGDQGSGQGGQGGQGGNQPSAGGSTPDVIINLSPDTHKVKICVGDECATLTRDPDNGTLVSDKPELVPSTTPEAKDQVRIPGAIANGKTVTVIPEDKIGNVGEPAVLPPVFVPEKPELEAKDNGDVTLTFPSDAREGDKVVLTYQPNPEQVGGDLPAREQITFTKQKDGSWTADKADVLPAPSKVGEETTVTIPAATVKDETPVSAYSENRENTARSESARATAGLGGDHGDTEPATTSTPDNIELEAIDLDGDGNPDQFRIKGTLAEADGVPVTIAFGEHVLAVVPAKGGKFEATFSDPADADIVKGSQLQLTAKAPAKRTSATKEHSVDSVTAAVSTTPPTPALAPSTTPTAKLVKMIDKNNPADGNPDWFEITGEVQGAPEGTRVEIRDPAGNLVGEGYTKSDGTYAITVKEASNYDLRLDKDPVDNLSVKAFEPGKGESPALTLPLQQDANTPVPMAFDDKTKPSTPEVTANPVDGSVKVKLPTDLVAGDKITVTLTPTDANDPVDVTLTKNPDGSWTSSHPNLVPGAIDDQAYVTIPESAVRDGSTVTAKATDVAGNESDTSTGTAGKDRSTNTPVVLETTSTNLDTTADAKPEQWVLKGKVPSEAEGTEVYLFDDKDQLVATTKVDGEGNFSFTLVQKGYEGNPADPTATVVPLIQAGNRYRLQAKATDKLPSVERPEVAVAPVPVLGDNKADGTPYSKDDLAAVHPNDAADPTTPTVLAGQPGKAKGDGSASIGLPANAVPGDRVEVTFTPEGDSATPVTLTVVKGEDGQWHISEPTDLSTLTPAPTVHGNTLTLPEDLLADGQPVKAKSIDNAGKESGEVSGTPGKDEVATTPVDVKVTAANTSENATLDPNQATVTGKGKPGETIAVFDQDGAKLGEVTIAEDASTDENGLAPFSVTLTEPTPADITADMPLTVVATHADKDDSDKVTATVPALEPATPKQDFEGNPTPGAGTGDTGTGDGGTGTGDGGDSGDTGTPATPPFADTTKPNPPSLSAGTDKGDGSVTLTVPTEPTQVGDRIELQVIPESAGNDNTPVLVTLTKQADGSWQSDNGLVPSIPTGKDSVQIPENSLKDGQPVKARTVDVAGNTSEVVKVDEAGLDDITTTPYDLVASAIDESSPADTTADLVLLRGKTDPGAEVTVKKAGEDTPLFTVTANDKGEFTVLVANPGATKANDYKAKLAQKDINAEVKTLEAGQSLSPADRLTLDAKHPEKALSDEGNTTVGDLVSGANGADSHPFDTTPPQAPQVTAIESGDIPDKALGSVEVALPTANGTGEAPQDGDTVTIRYVKTTGEPATIVATRENGAWKLPADVPATEATIDGDTVTLLASAVKDGSTVYAQTTDVAGNPSATNSADAAFEQKTALSDVTLRATKADPTQPATDTNPEVLTVTGQTDPGAEVTVQLVTAKGKNGQPDTVKTLTTTADKDGNFNVTFAEGTYPLTPGSDEVVTGHDVTVTATLVGKKAESAPDTQQVPSTRTMFVEAVATDVVDKGSAGQNDALVANVSDNTIDEVTFTGKVEKGAKLKVQVLAANGDVIAEKEFENRDIGYTNEVTKDSTDPNKVPKVNSSGDTVDSGDFSVTLTKADLKPNKAFAAGQTVKITAIHPTEAGIGETTVNGTALPALQDGTADHPDDKQATVLENSAITFSHSSNVEAQDGRTHASVTMPTEADVKKVTVSFNDESGTAKTAVFTRKTGGGWAVSTANGENTAGLSDIAGDTLTIAHDKLNGGTDANQRGNISVKVEDIAGQSKTLTQSVPADRLGTLTITSTTGVDKSERADSTAETITIAGTTDNGAEVVLLDKDEQPITAIKTTADANNGAFSLSFDVSALPEGTNTTNFKVRSKVAGKVAAQADSAAPSIDERDNPNAQSADKKHKGDNTAPALTVKATGTGLEYEVTAYKNGKQGENGQADPQLSALAKGDRITLNKVSQGGADEHLATFEFNGSAWNPVPNITNKPGINAPVAVKQGNETVGYKLTLSSADSADLNVGDTIKTTITDIAGNVGTTSQAQLPDPTLIDVAEAWAGARTKANENDAENATRLLLDASTAADKVNSGDVWVKVGKDNNKVKLSYIPQEGATYDATNGLTKAALWAIQQADGSWKVFSDENGQTESNKAEVVKLKQNGTEQGSDTPKYVISEDADAAVFIRLKESAVKDKSAVEVVSYDKDGNDTSQSTATPTKDGVRIVPAVEESASAEEKAQYEIDQETARTVSVTTDFDDATESSVSVLNATQTDANSHIVVNTATNADFAKETTAYIVQFDTDEHISADDRNSLGLADPNNGNAHNYLVALKVPNGENGGTTWALGLWSGEASSLDQVNLQNTYEANPKVATIDPATGVLTLKKEVVKGGSSVSVGTIDAYGNSATPVAGDSENPLTTKHTNNEDSVVVVPDPRVTPLGNGVLEVFPGDIPSKWDPNNKTETVIGTDHKTLVDVNGDGTTDITLSYDPANNTWRKTGNLPNGVTEVSFDPNNGKLVLNSTEAHTVKAKAQLNNKGKTEESKEISAAFALQDTTEYAADVAEVHPHTNGSVEIKPGLDNKKITVEYFTQGGGGAKANVTLEKGDDGQWKLKEPSTGSGHFDFSNGKIKLNANAVQDGTKVTAVGYDGNVYPADYAVETLRGQEVKADEHSRYALRDDNTAGAADQPRILAQGNDPSTHPEHHNPRVLLGNDNSRAEVKFTPAGKNKDEPNDKQSIIAKLEEGGTWSLKYPDGSAVPEEVATLEVTDAGVFVTLQHTALAPESTVDATGFDDDGHSRDSAPYTLPSGAGASGNTGGSGGNNSSGIRASGYTLDSLSDNSFELTLDQRGSSPSTYELSFKMYRVDTSTVSDVIVKFNDSAKSLTATIDGGSATLETIGITTRDTNQGTFTLGTGVDSFYRLIADSPMEKNSSGQLRGQGDQLLLASIKVSLWEDDPNPTTVSGYLKNEAELGAAEGGGELPVAEQATPVAITQGEHQGGMTLNPHETNTRLSVSYVKESGQVTSAVLVRDSVSSPWRVVIGNADDFILDGTNAPIIKPDSLRDEVKKGVSLKGGEKGKLYAEANTADTVKDAEPPAPTGDPEIYTNISNINETFFTTKLDDDVHVRQGLIIRKNVKPTGAFNKLKEDIEKNGKGTVTIDTDTTHDNIAGNRRPIVTINLRKQGNQPSDGAKLLIDGSLGETTAAWATQFSGPMMDMYISMDPGNLNDLMVIRNDLGDDDTAGQRTIVDMGHGHNVLSVGSSLEHFVLYEDPTARTAADRYRYFGKNAAAPAGWQKVEVLEHGKSGFSALASSVGGRVINTTVRMGDGNDLFIIEGVNYNDHYIIGHDSVIQMGGGNDALILTDAAKDNRTIPNRGTIGNSTVDMGSGDDFLKAVGISTGARIHMGSGNDTIELTRMTSSARIEAGDGNDRVKITGEVRDGAQIFLGSGDDVFEFGLPAPGDDPLAETSRNVLWGGSGTKSLFEGKIDGGDGYDVIRLHDTDRAGSRTALIGQKVTNLSSESFKGIEEIQLEQNTVVDIRYKDLLEDGMNQPLKITAFNGDAQANGVRYVDLGGHQLNNRAEGRGTAPEIGTTDSEGGKDDLNSALRWKKILSGHENGGKTYSVYAYGGDATNVVWVEEGVNIIVI